MSTIFEFCLPDFTDDQLAPVGDVDLSIPLSLGAICGYWRDIAWSTPTLWSSLVIRVTWRHSPHIVTSIAHEWLSRSGQLPLSIRICTKVERYDYVMHKTVQALADIINQYSTRWSDLDLYIPKHYYQHFRATDNHAPILKSIRFNSSANHDAKLKNFQLTCPRLERALLSDFLLYGINIQWDNLTHLTLHSMLINDSFLILRKTPRLVFCKVSGSRRGVIGSIGTVVLTSLKSLQLTTFVRELLDNLITPHLEEFNLQNSFLRPLEVAVIISFFRRSACSLRSLSVAFPLYFEFFVEGFMGFLQSMPSLNTLSTTSGDFDPRFIFQLVAKVLSSQSTSQGPQQGFLPNLKIFEYTGKLNLRPEFFDDLHSLLPAYSNALHGPLQLIKIDLTQHRLPKNLIPFFSNIVERGVTVNVTSKSEDIIQTSIDYFRRREDFFEQDWVDNLDSSLFS